MTERTSPIIRLVEFSYLDELCRILRRSKFHEIQGETGKWHDTCVATGVPCVATWFSGCRQLLGCDIVFSCRDSACFSVVTMLRQRFLFRGRCVATCLVLAGISLP